MNLSDSGYYNSLPFFVREDIIRSGMTFNNDEEINAYVASSNGLSPNSMFFSYPYAQGFSPAWPIWPF